MARLSPLDFCVFSVWGLVLSFSSEERQYFPQNMTKSSWADARRHCQVCFSELVTLTPENIQNITKGLTSDHWVGLRKRPVKASNSSDYLYGFNDTATFWSRWANGDPLSFQNWYLGHPVSKSSKDCCSCSCTCSGSPNATTNLTNVSIPSPSFSTPGPFTPFESECVKKPVLLQNDPDEHYIEDPCVAMLSFGAWVEKECSELLPFICYEDRFSGKVSVTDIYSTSARISWEEFPGAIEHYRVDVNGSVYNHTDPILTYALSDLSPGSHYPVQVFPVKCGRDLSPEVGSFYTVPNKVAGLQVIDQTEKCVSLNWMRPTGNVDLYIVQTKELKEPRETKTEKVTVCDLTPGSLHNFKVRSGVSDQTQWSKESTIDAYTRPAKVSNVKITGITGTSLILSWDKPQGSATGYRVTTSWDEKNPTSFTNKTEETGKPNKLALKDLAYGTKITLSVTALANKTLEGENVIVDCFTEPEDITNLSLLPTEDTVTAEWNFTKGSPLFNVELWHEEDLVRTVLHIRRTTETFSNLMSAANYTVTVYSVTEVANSSGSSRSIFTSPNPPRKAELSGKSNTSLTFTWMPPKNTETVQYLVTLNSNFWGEQWKKILNNETIHTFDNLKSGTTYNFYVQTIAGSLDRLSQAEATTATTDPNLRKIMLAMVCSSSEPLLCDREQTRNSAFQELESHFQSLLGNHVVWKLRKIDIAKTGK